VLGARVSLPQIILMLIAAALMIALNTYVQKTSTGRAMRSIALDMTGSLLMGINVNAVITKTFSLAQIVESHRYLESNQQIGKIVVTV